MTHNLWLIINVSHNLLSSYCQTYFNTGIVANDVKTKTFLIRYTLCYSMLQYILKILFGMLNISYSRDDSSERNRHKLASIRICQSVVQWDILQTVFKILHECSWLFKGIQDCSSPIRECIRVSIEVIKSELSIVKNDSRIYKKCKKRRLKRLEVLELEGPFELVGS